MISTDADAILQAIIDEPDVDLHRLAYADWCEENGQSERAEFIRLQIMLHGKRPSYPSGNIPLYEELATEAEKRERYLWAHYSCKWLGIGHGYHPLEWLVSQCNYFERGFVCTAQCTHDQWIKHGKEVCASQPIQRVEFSDRCPLRDRYFSQYFSWYRVGNDHETSWGATKPWTLANSFFNLLDDKELIRLTNTYARYKTIEHATAALSTACILYGKSK